MTKPEAAPQEILRGDILAMGRDDFVSMADVQGQISRGELADSVAGRQQLVVAVVLFITRGRANRGRCDPQP